MYSFPVLLSASTQDKYIECNLTCGLMFENGQKQYDIEIMPIGSWKVCSWFRLDTNHETSLFDEYLKIQSYNGLFIGSGSKKELLNAMTQHIDEYNIKLRYRTILKQGGKPRLFPAWDIPENW